MRNCGCSILPCAGAERRPNIAILGESFDRCHEIARVLSTRTRCEQKEHVTRRCHLRVDLLLAQQALDLEARETSVGDIERDARAIEISEAGASGRFDAERPHALDRGHALAEPICFIDRAKPTLLAAYFMSSNRQLD